MTISCTEISSRDRDTVPKIEERICKMVRHAIKGSGLSVDQFASAFSERAGTPITSNTLNDFAAPSKRHRKISLALIGAFCETAGDDGLQRLAAGPRLCKMIQLGESVSEVLADEKKKTRQVVKKRHG